MTAGAADRTGCQDCTVAFVTIDVTTLDADLDLHAPPAVLTRSFQPVTGSAVHPLVEEVTWRAWELRGADPSRLSEGLANAARLRFGCVLEAGWRPGRFVVVNEVAWDPDSETLAVRFAVGVLGPTGETASELEGLGPRLLDAVGGGGIYDPVEVDPVVIFDGADRNSAVIVPSTWSIGDDVDVIEVVSRFNPTLDPWRGVAAQVVRWPNPLRVRATLLATELSPADRLEIEHALARVRAFAGRHEGRAEVQFDVERAETTLLDLRASYGSPVFASDLSVSSPAPLPETLLRSLAGAFTSESDVLRQSGRVVVAGSRLVLGGFEVQRLPAWRDAHSLGLPLHGGLGPRGLRHLLTLAEAPAGWPLPSQGGIPRLRTHVARPTPVPDILREETGPRLGVAADGTTVTLPLDLRTRHLLATGSWGAGKSTLLFTAALADLRAGRPFLFLDPHGTAASQLLGFAHQLGRDPVVLDALDGRTARLRPLPRIVGRGRNRAHVESAVRRLTSSVAGGLPHADWTGPRFFAAFAALLEVVAAHGAELIDGAEWLNDAAALRVRAQHDLVSELARTTLMTLASGTADGADVRGWVASKLSPIVSGLVRRIVAPAGRGIDVADALDSGRPVIVSLAGLSTSEAGFIGHLVLGAVLDAALARTDDRPPLVTCYVDEAHRFPAGGLTRVMAEGRKFGIGLALATQSLGQLTGELSDLALSAGVQVAFRATPESASRLAPLLDVDAADLVSQPDLHAVVRVHGHPATSVAVDPYETCTEPYERSRPRPARRDHR